MDESVFSTLTGISYEERKFDTLEPAKNIMTHQNIYIEEYCHKIELVFGAQTEIF